MHEILPSVEQAIELSAEELGVFVLRYLTVAEPRRPDICNLNNFIGESRNYSGQDNKVEVTDALTEAWMWLETERMLIPRAGQRDWVRIGRRGRELLAQDDLGAYRRDNLLKDMQLEPVLARKVRPTYLRGDYETAIFQAFKEVEVRVRAAAGLGDGKIGVALMREAFHPNTGPLTDQTRELGERQAMMETFAGAIGLLKNPGSHRNTELSDPQEAAEAILFANYLLRIVDYRRNHN